MDSGDTSESRGGFCPWYPLAAASVHAPCGRGVYQVRVRTGLCAYERGKSAMVEYGLAEDLRASLSALAGRAGAHDLLCRHLGVPDEREARALYERLLGRFVQRFGSAPRLPRTDDEAHRDR